jgi:hypothetical protein
MAQDQFANPEQDAAHAIETGDYALLGVARFAVFVPGIEGDYETLRTKYKIRTIKGTSDIIIKNDPNSYNVRAENYARRYNRYVFNELGCDVHQPMEKCKHFPR